MVQRTEQIVRESPEIEALRVGLMQDALQLTRQPMDLPAHQVAGVSPMFQQAGELTAAGVGAYAPFLEGASGALGTAAGAMGAGTGVLQQGLGALSAFPQAQQMVTGAPGATATGEAQDMMRGAAGQFDPSAVEGFLNPYQQHVEDAIRRNFAQQQQQLSGQAVGSGAFGGARHGVMQAELGRAEGQTVGEAYARDYMQAMQQAQQAFEAQQARQQAAAQGIGALGFQQADLERMTGLSAGQLAGQEADIARGLGMGIGALGGELAGIGTQQAQLGALQSQLMGQDVQRLAGIGEMEREQQQQVLDAARQTQLEQLYQPYQDLAFRSDIFQGAPSTAMTVTAGTAPQPSTMQQIAGLGIAGLSAARGAQASGLFG